jgi:hypothetical protein
VPPIQKQADKFIIHDFSAIRKEILLREMAEIKTVVGRPSAEG